MAAALDDLYVDRILESIPELAGRLTGMAWFEVLHATARLLGKSEPSNASRQCLEGFYQFLDREYAMQAITTEVWLVAAGTEPLWRNGKSFWDIHQDEKIYFDIGVSLERPLYIAYRASGKVDKVHRVAGIEQGIPIVDRVPDLAKIRERWPREKHTIWHLADPVALPKKIRTGAGMYNRRVRCDFDLLLSCETVRQIEDEMRARRES